MSARGEPGQATLDDPHAGNVSSIETPAGTATYAFDPYDYRIERSFAGETSWYFLDGERMDSVYDGQNRLAARLFRGAVIDEVVSTYLRSASARDRRRALRRSRPASSI